MRRLIYPAILACIVTDMVLYGPTVILWALAANTAALVWLDFACARR